MSNLSVRIQSGPEIWYGRMEYASCRQSLKLTDVYLICPGSIAISGRSLNDLFGLIDDTSNTGFATDSAGDWARLGGAYNRPIAIGPATAAAPTVASSVLRAKFNFL